jgi:hypothetical protein
MGIMPLSIREDYWETFEIKETDLDFIYNRLLEIETPQTPQELVRSIIEERIQKEKQLLESQRMAEGTIYLPKNHYNVGQTLQLPSLNWEKGEVISVRSGNNPDLSPFEVIDLILENGDKRSFAAGVENHVLNQPVTVKLDDPRLNLEFVIKTYGHNLADQLTESLESNPDLVRIAGKWFPRALLVDVNIGHLNLAEALLDMESGGPKSTRAILEQIELPTDVNAKLTEFSLNLALQEDGRFDEVGPAGEILWFLRRLEPVNVQQPPAYLRYQQPVSYDGDSIKDMIKDFGSQVVDELEKDDTDTESIDEVTLSLIFPHWRAGTLPLSSRIKRLFPTAYESPRVLFSFIDSDTQEKFSGWVVRESKYVYGLRDWYINQGLIPGSLVHIQHGKKPGEVIIRAEKRRSTRDWIRTVLVGADGGIVFAMLKQIITSAIDERMTIAIPDVEAVDHLWEAGTRKASLEQVTISMMRELAKLNPQGHVHAQELYAAVNLIRRCPPGPILNMLVNRNWANHLGDLYFRLGVIPQEGGDNE